MASDNDDESLLTELLNSDPQSDRKTNPKRRYRRSKSTPMNEICPGKIDKTKDSQPPPPPENFIDRFSFKRVVIYLIFYLAVSTACFYNVMDHIKGEKVNGVIDSVYFCVVTMSTVGYGDLVPNSTTSKLLACAFVFSGMALGGLTLSKGADYLVEKQETLLIKALHVHQQLGPGQIMKELENHKVQYKCFVVVGILAVLFLLGILVLVLVEKLGVVDAFYCVCSTVTTLGYGDRSFSTKGGRIFAVFWILTSTICLAQFLCYIAELNTEKRHKQVVQYVLTRRLTKVDLEAADVDADGSVNAAEYILYKLKEMGKISQEEISLLLQEFENLDVDQSGTLTTRDLMLAQSSQTRR